MGSLRGGNINSGRRGSFLLSSLSRLFHLALANSSATIYLSALLWRVDKVSGTFFERESNNGPRRSPSTMAITTTLSLGSSTSRTACLFDQSIHDYWRTRTCIDGINTGIEFPNLLSGGSILAFGRLVITMRRPRSPSDFPTLYFGDFVIDVVDLVLGEYFDRSENCCPNDGSGEIVEYPKRVLEEAVGLLALGLGRATNNRNCFFYLSTGPQQHLERPAQNGTKMISQGETAQNPSSMEIRPR
ncbi:hypothetical protein CEY00_Acc18444 [Actinidia chinensis var. chinensis]|uniref:Uncharacterized protein n=1 Tax=Actinidia chinensis var. chinensis TaxID=1590841 RepID=A0A2R6QHJ1_ACTCC|nr:hypothetical protein CEY00_Acc18444 [Actinidia chinensis var. chinensis]